MTLCSGIASTVTNKLQSVQLSLPSYGHTKTDIQRGVARMKRVVLLPKGGKMGGKMETFNVKIVFYPLERF